MKGNTSCSSSNQRVRTRTKLDKIIDDAKKNGLELVPIDCSLKPYTLDEKNACHHENRHSRVFNRNLQRLNEALIEYPRKSVTFCGRNLYIVPSEEHEKIKKKVKEGVEKHRRKKKDEKEKKLSEEKEELLKEIEQVLLDDLN